MRGTVRRHQLRRLRQAIRRGMKASPTMLSSLDRACWVESGRGQDCLRIARKASRFRPIPRDGPRVLSTGSGTGNAWGLGVCGFLNSVCPRVTVVSDSPRSPMGVTLANSCIAGSRGNSNEKAPPDESDGANRVLGVIRKRAGKPEKTPGLEHGTTGKRIGRRRLQLACQKVSIAKTARLESETVDDWGP